MKRPTVLMILDGFGLSNEVKGNAVALADTPCIDELKIRYPFVQGNASGVYVGLPEGQMGNSEVGHLNMGAGRIVMMDLTRISKDISDGTFFENPALLEACRSAREKKRSLHLYGLLSDGGVHSTESHLFALLELASREKVENVYVHCFLDGRDTPPTAGAGYIELLQKEMDRKGIGRIATVTGRYYAMDRDKRWERLERAYKALALGEGRTAEDALTAVRRSYDEDVTDEFVEPTVILDESGNPTATVGDGDSIIFFNFRPDRAREITRAFVDEEFDGFARKQITDLTYVCFTEYDPTIPHCLVAYPQYIPQNTLGEYLASQGLTQLRLAETEKYAHVTFFFNGGVEAPFANEDRILVPSPKVATYDLKPEMSAPEVCSRFVEAVESEKYDVIIINFANPDMVGHTGVLPAAVAACETVDACVRRAVEAVRGKGGQILLLADHGNAEKMIDEETGEPFTAHTSNPVPFILVNADPAYRLAEGGSLCDIAPTLLELMGLPIPEEMTGHSLLITEAEE